MGRTAVVSQLDPLNNDSRLHEGSFTIHFGIFSSVMDE